jgi:succinyl-CoA synthetase beta subunit
MKIHEYQAKALLKEYYDAVPWVLRKLAGE